MKTVKCHNCGMELTDDKIYCANCGTANNFEDEKEQIEIKTSKSKIAAGLLGIFIGGLGIHNFYLGYNNKGIAQLLMSTVGWATIIAPIAASIWGFVEGIMILVGSIDEDAKGVKLRD